MRSGGGRQIGARRSGGTRGFTLLELLVAVGAVALVSVGLAAIFGATGRTVDAGRRVARFNAAASLLERQLRDDFAHLCRDGILVIHHEEAQLGEGDDRGLIERFPDDPNPRVRRIDEIVFFRTGEFTSARVPLHPSLVARSDVARVYYGHGARLPHDHASYEFPEIWDTNLDPMAKPGAELTGGAEEAPNEYAADWMLLRHVTLLYSPATAFKQLPPPPPGYGSDWELFSRDKEVQVAGQPAAAHVFRRLAGVVTNGPPPLSPCSRPRGLIRSLGPGGNAMTFASGLVDIATTDLAEIRAVVTKASVHPITGITDCRDWIDEPAWEVDLSSPGAIRLATERMRAWMLEALPANSAADRLDDRTRIRYEPAPPAFLGVADRYPSERDRAYRRADQMMLSAHNFLPGVSEFIVEWSYGVVNSGAADPARAGEMIWHGLPRRDDTNFDGTVDALDEFIVREYPKARGDGTNDNSGLFLTPYRDTLGDIATYPFDWDPGANRTRGLIHGDPVREVPRRINIEKQLTSVFGVIDPTFDPDNPAGGGPAAADQSAPWAWPRLVRITVTLCDPNEPQFEQTFQFIFEIPQAGQT